MYFRKKLIEVIIFSILIFILISTDLKQIYPIYGSHLFQDWIYIFIHSTNDCDHNFLFSDYKYVNGCKEYLNSNFVYPKIWLKLLKIITSSKIFEFILILTIFVFIYFNLEILEEVPIWSKILFLLSPIAILLFERGNNDIVIFIIVYLFASFYNKKNIFLSSIFLFLGCLLKIYTISLIPMFLIHNKKKKSLILIIIISSVLLYISNFEYILNNYNKSGLLLSFSSSVYIKILNSLFNLNINYKIFSILLLLAIIFFSLAFKINLPKCKNKNEIYYLIGSSIIVSSFFLSEGFVYKLVFLSFTLPLIHEYKYKFNLGVYKYFLMLTYLALFIEFFSFAIENIFQINYIEFKKYPLLNFENIFFSFSILFKNFIFWLLNINLILVSTKIFIRKFKENF